LKNSKTNDFDDDVDIDIAVVGPIHAHYFSQSLGFFAK